ncbi:sugar ABC transporter substrate-binding protein [Streptomyces sp. NPDC044780]|uniref:ABC transporter substrate-binding protein n=1 Tax=unclassified Streptomyces TaxID=2593676 RepID=UPI003401946D
MKLRKWSLAALATCLVVPLAACSGSGPRNGVVKLVLRQFDPESETKGLAAAIDKWNDKHPKIQVELETLSPNNVQQFAREANAEDGPDIDTIGYSDVAFLAKPRILLPLDDYIKRDPPADYQDLLAKDTISFDGKTWAMPWTADTMALVYNPKALAEAGVDSPPTTWAELAADAKRISSAGSGDTTGFCFPASGSATSAQWFPINYYLWSHGGTLIEKDSSGNWRTGVSQKRLAKVIDYFTSLFSSGAAPKANQAVQDYSDPSIVNSLANGSCAMSYLPPSTFAPLEKQAKSAGTTLTTAVMPSGLTAGATHLGGRALGINRNTAYPDQAWRVVKYLMSAETFATYGQFPASKATLRQVDVPASQRAYVQQLPHARSFGRYLGSEATIASIEQIVNQNFSAVYSGQKSSSKAAGQILDGLTEALEG